MKAASAIRIEKTVDSAASALFASAVGYAAYAYLTKQVGNPLLAVESGAATAVALLLSYRLLNAVQPSARRVPVPIFDVRDIEQMDAEPREEEPLDLIDVFEPRAEEPLDLTDILTGLGSDSRVVRLFDPAAMPTSAELKERIDDHLDPVPDAAKSADAAQALHDALAELRRSLR
jgi:hypothetical protein